MCIIINQVRKLHESQHAFKAKRGTDSALLSITNELEKAHIEHSTRIFRTNTTVKDPLIALRNTREVTQLTDPEDLGFPRTFKAGPPSLRVL